MEPQGMFHRGITVCALVLSCIFSSTVGAEQPVPATEVQEWFVVGDGDVVLRFDEDAIRTTGLHLIQNDGLRGDAEPLSYTVDTDAAMYEIIVTNRQLAALVGGELPAVGPTFGFADKSGRGVSIRTVYIVHEPSGGSAAEFTVFDGADLGLHLFDLSGAAVEFDDTRNVLTLEGDVRIAGALADRLGSAASAGVVIGELAATLSMQLSQTVVVDEDDRMLSATMHAAIESGTEGPFPSPGPDVIVGDLPLTDQYGRTGAIGSGTVGLSIGTTSCNKGDTPFNWFALPNTDHPMIPMNMYRLKTVNGAEQFEQIGQSWMKHGFTALQLNACGFGCASAPNGTHLGVGCSDPYSVGLNASQCGLGARAQLNPYTGVTPGGASLGGSPCSSSNYPARDHTGHSHDGIAHRLQVQDADLANAGARYFSEGQYLTPHETTDPNAFANQNMNNNVSHREISMTGPNGSGTFTFANVGSTVRESPAVDAWTGATQVLVEPAPMVDGRAFVSYKVTALAGGTWHYEYAVYNMNMDRAINSFSIPVHSSVAVTNVGFHFPSNHNDAGVAPAEQYANTAWTFTNSGGAATWSTDSFAVDANANAIRFGTLYNFRFDADTGPQSASVTLGLFKTATTALVAAQGPTPAGPPPVCGNGVVEAGEQCDDGNLIAGDGCDPFCQWETTCGNGIVEFGEQCDDGNTINTDACLNTCVNAACGDGVVWAGVEACDTAGQSATCDADCTLPVCGDGVLNTLAGEQCDDGNTIPGDGCNATCQLESNDLCASAFPIFEGATAFDTTAALTDGQAHAACQYDGQTYNDIWYEYTPTCSGNVTVSLCGSAYDTDLVIYNGCVCPLTDVELLACNDDNCGGTFRSELPSTSYPTIGVVAGNCYKIRVGGWNAGDRGTGTVTITNAGTPCFPDCNANGVDDAIDISSGTSFDINGNGTPDECEAVGNPIVGAKLYDKWWLELGLAVPIADHPLWQFRPDLTSNLSTGAATWRCKECHGWDYKGVAGVYGSGAHRTGIPGVLGTTMTEAQIFTLLQQPPNNGGGVGVLNGHDFGSVMTTAQINDAVAFVLLGAIDEVAFIDGVAAFIGSEPQGMTNYTTGGSIACLNCHGADGTTINFGTAQSPEWVGTVAVNNPWEFMHKGRFGHPAAAMPSWIQDGGNNQGVADIGKYAQINLPVDCTGTGACDDGDPCTANDMCVSGVCVGGAPPPCVDDTCTDCNANGIKDQCEGLQDCNADGIPDQCQAGDCNANGANDICDIVGPVSVDCDGGPVGVVADGATIFAGLCMFCHGPDGSGGVGPDIRNHSRVLIWNQLLPPTTHSGGAHPEFGIQGYADIEAFLAPAGSRGRPDLMPDECQVLTDCDGDGTTDGCELEAGTQVDLDYDGIPDDCQCTNPCSDGDACTVGDSCSGGTCVGGAPANCDDANACTTDSCNSATGCVNTAIVCDDGDACTTDTCNSITGCVFTPITCDDANACTADSCDAVMGCVNAAIVCDDASACTTDTCDTLTGCVFTPVGCDDANACTADSCDAVTGCVNAAVVCDDANACTTDTCDTLTGCVFTPVACDDANACTADSCDAVTGCVNAAIVCDDANACTTDTCDSVNGCANTPIDCSDGNLCTTDGCDAFAGCTNTAVSCPVGEICDPADGLCRVCVTDGDCDDGVFCNGAETCVGGSFCAAGIAPCDDGIACTSDQCNETTDLCVPVPFDFLCDNGLFCDGVETCDPLLGCQVGTAVDCDDGDLCTADSCDDVAGQCVNSDISADCDDGNPCTDDSCSPSLGCIATNNSAPCVDGDLCTSGDTCVLGTCVGAAVLCDDGNACTIDSCDPAVGCVTVCGPFGVSCDVGTGPGSGQCDGACVCEPAGTSCPTGTAAECCDVNVDGVRDDSCVWCACDAGVCANLDVPYGDMGGAFGDCVPDGFCNLADALHALTCFASTSPCDDMNVDVGGAFGACTPDGFCNLSDALHALTCFASTNPCGCGVPAAEFGPIVVADTTLTLVADRRAVQPGDTVEVRVFIDNALADLQSYQLHVAAGGGRRGHLELLDVAVEPRRDFVFGGMEGVFSATNAVKSQMLAGNYGGDVATVENGYLATFTYYVSPDARGMFVVDVLHNGDIDQTYVVASFVNKIEIVSTSPAVIVVSGGTSSAVR